MTSWRRPRTVVPLRGGTCEEQVPASAPTNGWPPWPVILAAAISITLGVWQAMRPVPGAARTPKIAAVLAPLGAAPVPRGKAVTLSLPAAVAEDAARPWLYEAAWQRPDLRWGLLTLRSRQDYVLALPGAMWPDGFLEIWRDGQLTLLRRGKP
jgi:hypothetical protein